MKKFVSFLLILICAAAFFNSAFSFSRAEDNTVYAYIPATAAVYSRGLNGEVPVYEKITNLPATYFAAVLEEGETAEGYIKVSYLDISGYMKKSEIEICDYEPVTKYAQGRITTSFDGQNVNLRQKPDHTAPDNIICTIPSGENLLYYGTVDGTALFPALGEVWYYVRYTNNGQDVRGYIYNAQGIAVKIENNVIEKVIKPGPPTPDPSVTDPQPLMKDWMLAVFIICLCIPAVLIVILIFKKPSSQNRTPRHYREQ